MDPIVSGALVSAVNEGSKEAAKVNAGLLERALGPTADVIGAELAGWTERRLKNAGRLADRAAEKAELTGRTGEANLRTAHTVLEEGSFADGSLAAEYFSGVLASSKTPDGQDDRGSSGATSWLPSARRSCGSTSCCIETGSALSTASEI
ncbi:hypothetical protein [Luteococcus japonicus]|uniref:hypothetical protein n=1 Tax=Luteococcus japonicus TaxID=33984 RepID=UPI00117DA57B|nr:hypothetical protein [Luteococcus japonicus]